MKNHIKPKAFKYVLPINTAKGTLNDAIKMVKENKVECTPFRCPAVYEKGDTIGSMLGCENCAVSVDNASALKEYLKSYNVRTNWIKRIKTYKKNEEAQEQKNA